MVKIRLTRIGTKGKPFYRIVATDSRKARDGEYIELIGTMNPAKSPREVKIDENLALKWLKNGALCSDTVKNIFKDAGIMKKFSDSKN